ncbi:MAG: helix-turn-helix transcriptional regulator [Bacteroidetes bacterium]|nr:helix-turn-helix transcriptional regulator [Bacteroidota bacterium]
MDTITYEMSDAAVLQSLGTFIRETRLRQNKTQDEVATASGIKRMTLVRIEKGGGGTMSTFVRILRSLQLFHLLSPFAAHARQISPLELARLEKSRRQRARPPKRPGQRDSKKDKSSDW